MQSDRRQFLEFIGGSADLVLEQSHLAEEGSDTQLRQWPAIRGQHLDPTRFDDIGRISGFTEAEHLGTGGNLFAWQAFIHCLCPKTGRDDDNDITEA